MDPELDLPTLESGLAASTTRHSMGQHGTAQHATAQHSMAQHSLARHSTAQHSLARHSTAPHSNARRNAAKHKQLGETRHSTTRHSTAHHSTSHHILGHFGPTSARTESHKYARTPPTAPHSRQCERRTGRCAKALTWRYLQGLGEVGWWRGGVRLALKGTCIGDSFGARVLII